jgi:hypothetical protein
MQVSDNQLAFQISQGLIDLPGRVAVLMEKEPEKLSGVILTDYGKQKLRSQTGIVCMSGRRDLKVGDTVEVHPNHGLYYYHSDAEWVPEGREVRFLNDSDAVWAKHKT